MAYAHAVAPAGDGVARRPAPVRRHLPARIARSCHAGPRGSLRGAARRRRHPLHPGIGHRLCPQCHVPTPPSSIPKGIAVAHSSPSSGGHRDARAGGLRADRRLGCRSSSCEAVYSTSAFEMREPILAGDEQFASVHSDRRLDAARPQRDCRMRCKRRRDTVLIVLGSVDDGGDAAGAVDAAADPRDSERPEPARPRRARRARWTCPSEEFKDLGARSKPSARSSSAPVARAMDRCRPLAVRAPTSSR